MTASGKHADAQAVLARSGRTFHLASHLLPPRMRWEAAELYAFCRKIDDLADEAGADEIHTRNDKLALVIRALKVEPLGDEAAALGWPVELERRLPGISEIAGTLTQALAADTGPRRIADEQELLAYAFGVAGTVGLMMCRILGAPPAGARAASHLGIAMQLTNIARDVCEDLGRDRIYLPVQWIAASAVEAAVAGAESLPLVRSTERLLTLAEQFYRSADAGMHYLPWRARFGILAAASCYREIGILVSRDVTASWRCRVVVPRQRKAALVLRAAARSIMLKDRAVRAASVTEMESNRESKTSSKVPIKL